MAVILGAHIAGIFHGLRSVNEEFGINSRKNTAAFTTSQSSRHELDPDDCAVGRASPQSVLPGAVRFPLVAVRKD